MDCLRGNPLSAWLTRSGHHPLTFELQELHANYKSVARHVLAVRYPGE